MIPPRFSLLFCAALVLTLADALWVLSLPCFPSADGPIHLYYVHVFGMLLGHSNAVYPQFFSIRHALPPYSLYYYGLLALSKAMPLLLADRWMICLYFFSFLFGFRYLARAIGPAADVATCMATLLLLNWPLGMGFVNFCLALSMAFWATGVWLRLQGRTALRYRMGFVLLATLVMLTHPVSLLLLLAVTGSLLLVRGVRGWHAQRRLPEGFGADVATFSVACLNLLYLKLFVVAHPLRQVSESQPTSASVWLHRFLLYGSQHALAFVIGRSPEVLLYRMALLLILVVPAGFAAKQRLRNRAEGLWTTGDTFATLGFLLLFGLPLVPPKLNGSFYFADRLAVCVWLAFLLGLSGWTGVGGTVSRVRKGPPARSARVPLDRLALLGVLAFALVTETALLRASDRLLRPAASAIASLDRTDVPDHSDMLVPGSVGFVLEDARPPAGSLQEGVSWNPYYWALAHLLRHNEAILANPPWADVTILPVGPSSALPASRIPALQEPVPTKVGEDLLASPADLEATLASTSFLLVNRAGRPAFPGPEPLLASAAARAQNWRCRERDWYRLCVRPAMDPPCEQVRNRGK